MQHKSKNCSHLELESAVAVGCSGSDRPSFVAAESFQALAFAVLASVEDFPLAVENFGKVRSTLTGDSFPTSCFDVAMPVASFDSELLGENFPALTIEMAFGN